MPEHNPYAAPQITEHVIKTTVAPVNRRHRQPPWEEPLRTKLAAIARHQRAMLVCTALLLLATLVIAAWVGSVQRDFPGNLAEGLLLGLLAPVALLLGVSVYQLVVRLEDGDSPVFLALTALVPGFNLLMVFYLYNLARQYLRESGIAGGWTGITAAQFTAQVELLRETQQGSQPSEGLPMAEEIGGP